VQKNEGDRKEAGKKKGKEPESRRKKIPDSTKHHRLPAGMRGRFRTGILRPVRNQDKPRGGQTNAGEKGPARTKEETKKGRSTHGRRDGRPRDPTLQKGEARVGTLRFLDKGETKPWANMQAREENQSRPRKREYWLAP